MKEANISKQKASSKVYGLKGLKASRFSMSVPNVCSFGTFEHKVWGVNDFKLHSLHEFIRHCVHHTS